MYSFYGLCMQLVFAFSLLAADASLGQKSQSMKDVKVSISFEGENLVGAFDKIEKQTGFSFTYLKNELKRNERISDKYVNVSLYDLLSSLSQKTGLRFHRVNDNINVKKVSGKKEPIVVEDVSVTGKVTDENGEGLPGVSVVVKGTTTGTTTNLNGEYKLSAPEDGILSYSFVGYLTKEMAVGARAVIDIQMEPDVEQLEEVVVVGFGTQKKEAVVGAMSSVKPAELKIPSSNLTTALAGRISGVVSYQTSGEPGADNAQFFVRGVASFNGQNGPLILIDGVELTADDLARLQPDDIESFSVLKDPTTTAIYGARGANGIILVTTKTGENAAPVVNLRLENSFSQPVSLVDLADPVTHMQLQNEAERTRGGFATFTEEQIAGTIRGGDQNIYPAVDWYDELFKDYTSTQRVNMNVRGGGAKVRYYVAGSFNKDNGLLEVDKTNSFTNNINLKRYLLRSNINIDLHKNTEMIVRLHSTIDDYRGPLQGGNAIYNAAVRTSPSRFPAVITPDATNAEVPHITFGNARGPRIGGFGDTPAVWFNPYAELQRGYRDFRRQLGLVQLEFKQDLGSLVPGLSARFLGNSNSTSFFESRRAYSPYFYETIITDRTTDEYIINPTNEGDESLSLEPSDRIQNSVLYMEAALNYYRTYAEKHNVSGLLVFTAREFLDGNPGNNVQLSLPSRNLTLAGRYNYDYDNRYFAEFNFGYNGSERFASNNRFGFFPSFGLGWLISNESFFTSSVLSRLKLRASFGWVGNDKIGNTREDRFFYLSEVDINVPGRGTVFGTLLNEGINGVSISRYSNPRVTWETSRKLNIGLEANLFDDAVQFRVDAFEDKRTNILQARADIPTTLGLQAQLLTNVGEVTARGIDASLDINHYFSNDFWITARSTFTYSDNEFKVFEEPNYEALGSPWRSNIGKNVNVAHGYIAERLFVDDEEARNSPVQFGLPFNEAGEGDYGGGDIKYRDVNNDGKITDLDRVPIGKPTVPKITYGLGVSTGYKKLDFNIFFQGLGETSFFINPVNTAPFVNSLQGNGLGVLGGGNGIFSENGLLQAYADSHWSEENRDVYALWPRLSTNVIQNNAQTSTWWLRDGSFIRLKQVELGYTFIDSTTANKLGITKLRVYATGTNLAVWSKFKLWDPELGGNGLNYPLQRVVNLGVHIGF